MGDVSPSANPGGEPENPEPSGNHRQTQPPEEGSSTSPQSTNPPDAAAFQGQYLQICVPPSNPFSGQLETPPTHASSRQGPYDMSAMTNALPQAGYRPGYSNGQQHQRYAPTGLSMIPQMAQFPGQPHMSQLANQQYYIPQHQIPPYYSTTVIQQHQQQQHQVGSTRDGMGMGYYASHIMMPQSPAPIHGYYYPTSNHFSAQNPAIHNHLTQAPYYLPDRHSGDQRDHSPLQRNSVKSSGGFGSSDEAAGHRSSVVRGPPRKPRQSGHAIWIGNLPPQTQLMSLVHHVCREATGLESLFLISKSNCAFANFKDESSCTTAQQSLHDSNFQSVRLVSRLRKSTVEGTSGQTAPTGPAAISTNPQTISSDRTPANMPSKSVDSLLTQENGIGPNSSLIVDGSQQKDKFFILKSLTVEDLELSVQNGVWATQSHNEEALNDAFGAADNVYLVFSANKSGEYFGYARMVSQINHDPAAAIEFAPKAQTTNDTDLPKAIPTEATDTCPRGRIIDDSARGTIFWEVERDEIDGASDAVSEEDSESAAGVHDGEVASKAWGKPFKLEWLSTTRLPFYRTRGLRNPWNSNREVKIARDGTELEPTVGRKLIGLFNRVQSPVPVATMGVPGIAPGYPPQPLPPFH
ncbi:putative yt521-b-like splicing [Rosellinia necatrix]|uniref:Putative yt521-b-like splicing n=1 Tax=Rosellinia necatrix TaxID=77044 RepID=A0A1S7UK11_ROSNE|nr:putative yt521-b-like splicing [Rosellinia necatrix]